VGEASAVASWLLLPPRARRRKPEDRCLLATAAPEGEDAAVEVVALLEPVAEVAEVVVFESVVAVASLLEVDLEVEARLRVALTAGVAEAPSAASAGPAVGRPCEFIGRSAAPLEAILTTGRGVAAFDHLRFKLFSRVVRGTQGAVGPVDER
jgi:hypothetical protein